MESNKYEYIILDIETSTKLHPWIPDSYLSSIGIKTSTGETYIYFFNPLIGDYDKNIFEINWFLQNTKEVVGHHFLFDLTWLDWLDFRRPDKIYCTMNGEYLLRGQVFKDDNGYISLNNLASHYGVPAKLDVMKKYWDEGVETCDIPVNVHREYLSQDLDTTEAVYLKQRDILKRSGIEKVFELTNIKTQMLARAISKGAPFDRSRAEAIVNEAVQKVDECELRIRDTLGMPNLNVKSSRQLCAALYGGTIKTDGRETYTVTLKSGEEKEKSRKCKIDVVFPGVGWKTPFTTKKGGDTVLKDALKMLKATTPIQKELLPALIERTDYTGRITTLSGTKGDKGWINSLGTDGRIHGRFSQTFTSTGRIKCQNPNLLNIPREGTSPLKSVFNPGKGKVIINADLSQIEWRAAAQLCGDKTMVQELVNDIDIHTDNAINILEAKEVKGTPEFKKGPRQLAKVVSFRLLYGGSANGFANDPQMPQYSMKKWDKIVTGFLNKYSGLVTWWDRVASEVHVNGFFRLPSGRIIPSPSVDFSSEKSKASWSRQLKNYPVQSFSADILLVVIQEYLRRNPDYFNQKNIHMFLPVYDSLVFECSIDDAEATVSILLDIFDNLTNLVRDAFDIQVLVPFLGEVEIGPSYDTTEKINKDNFKDKIKELKTHVG